MMPPNWYGMGMGRVETLSFLEARADHSCVFHLL